MIMNESTLVARINRHLQKIGLKLRKSRGAWARLDLGDFFVIDLDRNVLLMHHVDIASLDRSLVAGCFECARN
jgi:hypothetical protein